MNKKGNVITYLPFKKYLILVAVLIVLYLGYYFFILKSAGIVTLPKACPEGIIPDRLNLMCQKQSCTNPTYFEQGTSKWADGTPLTKWQLLFNKGSREGENVNYMYANNVDYYKKPINPDGTVGKEIRLKVNLVINPNDAVDEGKICETCPLKDNVVGKYKVIDYECRS